MFLIRLVFLPVTLPLRILHGVWRFTRFAGFRQSTLAGTRKAGHRCPGLQVVLQDAISVPSGAS
jgi:hypothetical protein